MIKQIIVSVCLLVSLGSIAQEGTASPYSFYGIGEVRFKGTHEFRSMGGIAIEQDSIHMNLQNPASYGNLKLSTFSLGATYATTTLKADSKSENARRTTLDYLAVGLPMGKFGVGFGLIPFSSVGYKIRPTESLTENNQSFNGKGGLNKAFLGVGYKITPQLSVGADVQYDFGKIETNNFEYISGIAIGTRELNNADLSGVNFNLGMMYQRKIDKKLSLFSSLTYSVESSLTSKNTRNIATAVYNENFELGIVDVLEEVNTVEKLKLPSKISAAAGIGEARKWLVGIGYTFQQAGELSNKYNALDNVTYKQNSKYSIGGYYIPNYKSFTSYPKRITYRGGFRYEQTGLVINSQPINDLAVTMGFGLPLSGTFSNVNIGVEFGQRGTTKANLIQENYANVSVGFSLNEQWFVRRKFN
jgi:long-subunit fatty acid transport protein